MQDTVNIKGLSALGKFMEQLTPKVEANVMRGGLRAGMNVVKPVAQHSIHSVSGALAAGLIISTRRRDGVVTAKLKATGPHGAIAHLVEFGTKAHKIAAKVGGWLSFRSIFAKAVLHPGAAPKPFMRPALDGQAASAVIATAEYIKNRLTTKEGLDASHVMIAGDDL